MILVNPPKDRSESVLGCSRYTWNSKQAPLWMICEVFAPKSSPWIFQMHTFYTLESFRYIHLSNGLSKDSTSSQTPPTKTQRNLRKNRRFLPVFFFSPCPNHGISSSWWFGDPIPNPAKTESNIPLFWRVQ